MRNSISFLICLLFLSGCRDEQKEKLQNDIKSLAQSFDSLQDEYQKLKKVNDSVEGQNRQLQEVINSYRQDESERSARQLSTALIDYISRLHFDLKNAKRKESTYLFFYSAYGGGRVPIWEVERRISAGLEDSTNLPAIVAGAKVYYGINMAALTLHELLPSLSYDECTQLISKSEFELKGLAGNYSRYIKPEGDSGKF